MPECVFGPMSPKLTSQMNLLLGGVVWFVTTDFGLDWPIFLLIGWESPDRYYRFWFR